MTPRRHRRWGAALLAAAAVTVGGYTVAATGALDELSGGTSADEAAAGSAAGDSTGASAGAGAEDQGGAESAPQADPGTDLAALPMLSSATLERDAGALVERLREGSARKAGSGDESQSEPQSESQSDAGDGGVRDSAPLLAARDCVLPPARGTSVGVVLDGRPATAVVSSRDGSGAVVQVWSCRSPVRLARVVVAPTGR